jgi:hypothetical protein
MWWLLGMWWLFRDVVARGMGWLMGMWWLLGMWWLRGCGGSGDLVAQLAKATERHQTDDAAVPGSNPAPPQSPEWGQGN